MLNKSNFITEAERVSLLQWALSHSDKMNERGYVSIPSLNDPLPVDLVARILDQEPMECLVDNPRRDFLIVHREGMFTEPRQLPPEADSDYVAYSVVLQKPEAGGSWVVSGKQYPLEERRISTYVEAMGMLGTTKVEGPVERVHLTFTFRRVKPK